MSSYSKTVISTKKKQAFTAELTQVLGKRGMAEAYSESKEESQFMETQEFNEDRDIYVAKHDYLPEDENCLALRKGEKVIILRTEQESESATTKWFVQSIREPALRGWVPSSVLTLHDDSPEGSGDAKFKREAVIRELVETEEEFGRDIQQVVDHYLKPIDNKSVPSVVRENKDLIFGNLKQIAELHNSVLIEGIKYYANEPRMLGKTFIRLERDFDKHVSYCRDEPAAQDFLQENNEVRDYFEEVSQRLGDDKSLSEHLKLPIQRINDYQLLLKELVKYSNLLGEDTTDLGKALELMLAVPHRANDNKFISNIEGYHGNIHKLGRLLRHDWFSVTDREGKSKDRYLFLFKARILICKVRRISEDRFVFVLKDIIRLPEVEVKDHKDSDRAFELHHKQPGFANYPLTISAHRDRVKNSWLAEIREYASDVLALAEHAADDLRLQAQPEDKKDFEPLTGIQLEPATPGQELPIERLSDDQNILPELLTRKGKLREVPRKAEEGIGKVLDEVVHDSRVGYKRKELSQEEIEELLTEKKVKTEQEEVEVVEKVKLSSDSSASAKRKEEDESKELPSEKKVKTEQEETEGDDMDRFSSSRRSLASRRVEEFRSVSSTSSQEVYVETSSARHQMSSSSSSARSMKVVEESAALNGRTISHTREVTGDVDGFSSHREIAAGARGGDSYTTIEEVTSGNRGSVDYTSAKRDSKDLTKAILGEDTSSKISSVRDSKSLSSSSSKSVFSKTIGGNSLNLGDRAVFECEVDENVKVTWLKDNKPLSIEGQSDRFTIISSDNSHRLEIFDVKDADAGIYTARAFNAATNTSSSCTAQLAIDKNETEEMKLEEGHPPFFIVHLKDTELLENTFLRFMIKVKGNPNPDVKFYKDDRLVTSVHPRITIVKDNSDKGFYELVIQKVEQEDAGNYKCYASNAHGEVECEANVSVVDEKKLFEGLEGAELLAPGETPHFTWLRDGQPFDPEERFKVLFKDEEDSLALVFQHVKPEDAGLYTCVASTSTGKISCSAELTVQGSVNHLMKEPAKPKISTEVKKQEASIGGSAMLELKVEGYPKPQVQWTKGDKEIKVDSRHKLLYEDDESISLVIKGVTPDDAGDYKVKAINDLGEDSDVIHLTVKAPPKFKRKLTGTEIMAGQEIRMSVDVEGSPKPTIQWYKDGLLIKKSDRVKMFEEASTEFTLVIDNSTLEDAGSYSVVATNELSQCSDFCQVQVHSPPQFIKGMTKSIETKEGDNISFQVKVRGDPEPAVKWLHAGKELKPDGKHIRITEDGAIHTLIVSGIGRGDAGKYTCELSNPHGTNSSSGDLNVRCSPQFRTKLSDTKANEGDTNIEFTVNVEAFPKPNIQWFHDEVEITEKITEFTRVEEGDNYKLIIKEVTKELSGKYTCKVVNELGENTTSSTFTVYSKPKFRKGLKDVQVDEGDSLTLQVEIEGVPEPTVKWYKNGEEVTGDAHIKISRDSKRVENYSMTFTLVKPEDGGEYEVRASNEMGTTVSQSTVTVQTKTSHIEDNELVEDNKEKVPKKEKAEKVDAEEESPKKTHENELDEKPKKAKETEGRKRLRKIIVEDVDDDEERDVFPPDNEKAQAGTFTCVEVNIEESEYSSNDLPSGSFGIIEEFSDGEDKQRLSVSRGISIISVSEEETKQSLSPDDGPMTTKEGFLFENDVSNADSKDKRPDISDENNLLGNKKGKLISSGDQDMVQNSLPQTADNDLDKSNDNRSRRASKSDANEKTDGKIEPKIHTKQMNGDVNDHDSNIRRGSKADVNDLKRKDSVKDLNQKQNYSDMNGDDNKSRRGSKAIVSDRDDVEGPGGKSGSVSDLPEGMKVRKAYIIDVIDKTEWNGVKDEPETINDEDFDGKESSKALKGDTMHNGNFQNGPQNLDVDSGKNSKQNSIQVSDDDDDDSKRKQSIGDLPKRDRKQSGKYDKEPLSGDVDYDKAARKQSITDDSSSGKKQPGKYNKESSAHVNDDDSKAARKQSVDNVSPSSRKQSVMYEKEPGSEHLNDNDSKAAQEQDVDNVSFSGRRKSRKYDKESSAQVNDDESKTARKQSVNNVSPSSRKQSVMYDKDSDSGQLNNDNDSNVAQKQNVNDVSPPGKELSGKYDNESLSAQMNGDDSQAARKQSVDDLSPKSRKHSVKYDKESASEQQNDEDSKAARKQSVDDVPSSGRKQSGKYNKEPLSPQVNDDDGKAARKQSVDDLSPKSRKQSVMYDKESASDQLNDDDSKAARKQSVDDVSLSGRKQSGKYDKESSALVNGDDGRRESIVGKTGLLNGDIKQKGKRNTSIDDDDVELDPEVAELLKRVQKQRSVLEEILRDKDGEKGSFEEILPEKDDEKGSLEKILRDRDGEKGSLEEILQDENGKKGSAEEVSRGKDGEKGSLEKILRDKDGKKGSLEKTLQDKDSEKGSLEEILQDKDGKKGSLEKTLRDKDGKKGSLEEVLQDKDGKKASVEEVLNGKDGKKGSHEKILRDKDGKKGSLEKTLRDKDGEKGVAEAFPQILSADMESKNVFETLPTHFEVNAVANPRPDVKWFKDGNPIEPSDNIKLIEDGDVYKLEIDHVKKDDGGDYKCVVSNRLGEKVQEATLTVTPESELRGPRVKVPLKDVKIPKTESGEMTVVFTADPEPEIKWTHGGNEVDASFVMKKNVKKLESGLFECEYTLQIPSGKHEDTGIYKIEANNKYGYEESSARLDIILRPEILVFKDVTVAPHEETELIAVIIANPKPKLSWNFDGKVIKDDDRHKLLNDHKKEIYKMQLKNADKTDEGIYKLTASNTAGETSAEARISVHTEPPAFIKKLDDQIIKEYALAEFKVRANGVPKPQITWFKDGKELKSGEDGYTIETIFEGQASSTLTIEHFAKDHVGIYTVKAVNMAGECECSGKLKMVQLAPAFLKPLDRTTDVSETEPLELKAKIEGSPLPDVKWFKDGKELKDNDRIKLTATPDGNIKLTIDSVEPGDSGQYKLVLTNPNGERSGICAVVVNPAPKKPLFVKELSDMKIVEGEPLSLESLIEGYPEPKVKWLKDGNPIRPSQSLTFVKTPNGQVGLEIDNARPEDAGVYTLTISNKSGEASSKAQVEVSQKETKPQFLIHLMPTNVVEGFPARMEVKVVGHPTPELTWTRNGKPLEVDGQRVKIVRGSDGTECLMIDRTLLDDAGEFAVIAKNPLGEVITKAPLTVTSKNRSDQPEEKPAFVKDLRDTSTEEGEPLYFSAPIIGNPIPDVEWEKDGEKLEPSDRIRITCDGNKVGLEINPSNLGDAGNYKCKLSNPLGEAESAANGNVKKIFQPPKFTQRFIDQQQVPSYDAKFLARVSGVPKPEVSWFKDGVPIYDSDKYRIKQDGDSHCLYVKDVEPGDEGQYKCLAKNKEGEATCEAKLQVVDKIQKSQKMEPPSFLKKIGDCEVFKGMTAKFTACATGYPEPEVEWYRGEDKLYPSERIRMEKEGTGLLRLSIIGVDPDVDVGKYRCRIFNDYGEDSCEANIVYDSLDFRPRKPIGDQYTDYEKYRGGAPLPLSDPPIISRMSDRKLTLSWKPSIPYGPREPVTYLVEMCEQPDGEWFTARRGIRSCVCDISNLEPFRDYKFRIRVENKYGTSDPSPFALTHRARLLPEPPKFPPHLPPGVDFDPHSSPYFPKDFDIDRPPHDKYAQAPRFLRQEHDAQYGVKGHNCNLFWFVYGYPKPKMEYFFNDEPIEMGGRYDSSYTRNGQATLFINKMLDRDVGVYEAVATNEHGQARQRVRLEIAEYPQFLQRPEETSIMMRKSGRLVARVIGVPYPEIKWYKDWQPLAPSSRVKITFIEPDTCVLTINDAMSRDEGLYSISASNIAGTISSSVSIKIEDNEAEYSYMNYDKGRHVKARTKPMDDRYDLGDELGRGTQGITYHAVERSTGRNYAAKVMHGKGNLRALMRNELDIMNQLNHRKLIRLHDAYEDPTKMTLVMELAGGGELLDNLTKQTFTTESEIASYIRQVLWGLEHMHDQNIAHLGLTPGDLLISHAGSDDLKICDFGLSRRILFGKNASLEYGMPEYVSPEIVKGDGVGTQADMWALGVITHVLLTGISPFKGNNDVETLNNVKDSKWSFQEDVWRNLSKEARDFITRLLVVIPEGRMDVKEALKHPWLNLADKMPPNEHNITTDSLRNYYNSLRDWYGNASCRKWFRRQPLDGAFTHPSRMVYPPGSHYTPEATPDRYLKDKDLKQPRTWEDQIPSREPVDYELGIAKSESHYQNGPDTYLLQLRDVDFPVRLREYMKVAANRQPTGLGFTRESLDQQPHIDWRAPIIRERRRFTDVMDEEIDDERKARINKYGSADTYSLRRLRNELGVRPDAHVEAEAMIESKRDGHAPFFREKPQITAIREEQPAEFACLAVGEPKPVIQWFKNDMVVSESNRIKIVDDESGRSVLKLNPALSIDAGIYKVVARNKVGQTVARTRLIIATVPAAPDSPEASEVSDTEVLLRWKLPRDDGNSPILCYNLQYKESESTEWTDVASNIDHEFWVVRNLNPNTGHIFRLAARNNLGWSAKGIPTETIKTKEPGSPKISVTSAMKHYQTLCENGKEVKPEETAALGKLNYDVEISPIEWSSEQPTDKYNFISEIHRGQFSVVVKGINKSTEEIVVGKLLEWRPDTEELVNKEFENLRSLRHERISSLHEAFRPSGSTVAVFIEEKLQGADILTYLASRHEYSEQMVATAVTQVLDALHYLHWRGFCHLNIQPDNIVMASVRSIQVKLVDLGSAQRVSKLGTVVRKTGSLDYTAPEVLCEEPAFPQSDIWSLGVLTYILLSGTSPFLGLNNEETRQNINFVRYRFEHLYKELTQEATRFLMLIFKRSPSKRPSAEECHEHRWLLPTEYMIKRRERAVFLGNRLKEFSDKYHTQLTEASTQWDPLSNTVVGRNPLARSNSIQEELLINL